MSERRGYYTDTIEEQWAMIGSGDRGVEGTTPPASGHVGQYEMRRIVDAIIYQSRSGCQWSLLPTNGATRAWIR